MNKLKSKVGFILSGTYILWHTLPLFYFDIRGDMEFSLLFLAAELINVIIIYFASLRISKIIIWIKKKKVERKK